MSGGHSEVVPRLPIPNRTVKRLSADDSAGSRVKVGHRQTPHTDAQTDGLGVGLPAAGKPPVFSGDHSRVAPRLPIPNRTVKRSSADDSADCRCESRTLPEPHCESPNRQVRAFCIWDAPGAMVSLRRCNQRVTCAGAGLAQEG